MTQIESPTTIFPVLFLFLLDWCRTTNHYTIIVTSRNTNDVFYSFGREYNHRLTRLHYSGDSPFEIE